MNKMFTVHIGWVGQFKNARLTWKTVYAPDWMTAKTQVEALLNAGMLRVVQVDEGEFPTGLTVWEVDE